MPKSQPKKKPRRRGAATPGVDPNEARRHRLEARRAQKAAALEALRRRQRRARLVRLGVLAALAAGAGFLVIRSFQPEDIAGHAVQELSATGVGDHRSGPQQYESVPPVSGPHDPGAAPCGVHDTQPTDENFVHTLEHGAVAILYDPTLELEEIQAIEAIVSDFDSHTVSAPYTGMPDPIAVASWSRLMRLETLDEDAVREYIDKYRQNGPEDQDCPNTQESPFGAIPSPSPAGSPPAEPTETGDDKGSRRKKND
ncbi:MAG: DUF3105 domain-containing protein [Actinomycetota bacterium]